jgi:hypothetical protein
MSRFIPTTVTSDTASGAAVNINSNFASLAALIDLLLMRDGSAPNSMLADLDLNHFNIRNVGAPTDPNDAVRLTDLQASLQSLGQSSVSVKTFGAVGDGVTDDHTAFQNALNYGVGVIKVPTGRYRLSATITIPSGVFLVSDGPTVAGSAGSGGSASFGGTELLFDNGVAVCVEVGGTDNNTAGLCGLTIRRAGSNLAGSIGVRVNSVQMGVLQDVYCHNHSIGFDFKATGTGGIALWLNRVFSAAISDAHWVVDGWPELRASHCRFGNNGVIDTNCNAYIRIQGGGAGSGSGPNTITLDNCQFNQGNNAVVDKLIDISNIAKAGGIVSTIRLTDCYAESYNTGISTDATVLNLRRLSLKGCTFNSSINGTLTNPVHFSLNAATAINEWEIVGNEWFGSDVTITTRTINGLSISNNRFGCPVSITATDTSNSTATLTGNTYASGGLTLAGGNAWFALSCVGDVMQSGTTLTNTAGPAKNVTINVPGQSLRSWTPVLNFGGASTGITYSLQSATCQVLGNLVVCEFRIILTSKGSATGICTITGVPAPYNTNVYQTGGGGMVMATNALTGITGPIMAQYGSNSAIKLVAQNATATAALTDANFTNTSEVGGHIVFFL